ncbi:hypothetical protein SNE40_000064 [Patella caerulea]|uniref:UMOD/GP2/OIT3-like D8C domain-containing protein n=1 Tax=Patella caerulea TaxID=87958 RepID=A0AAN8K9S2_PATCE
MLYTLNISDADPDPCNMAYTLVDEGWRSINCKMEYFGCDRYMSDGWYRVQEKNSQNYLQMPTSCVPSGRCGVVYPIWLNGSHPSIQDGVVNRTVCVGSFKSCCHHAYPVRIKNCTDYMVYYLERAHGCMERYCFGDSATCNTTDKIIASDSTMTATTTPEKTVTTPRETRTSPPLDTTPNLVETSSVPESVTEIETSRHTTPNEASSSRTLSDTVQVSNSTTLSTRPRPEIRTMDTTLNLVEPFSDDESVTTVVLNSDRSLTGIKTTTYTLLNGGQIKGRPIEAVRESDPKLVMVIVVLSTLLVVLTAAVIIFIITKIRARKPYGTWLKEESRA